MNWFKSKKLKSPEVKEKKVKPVPKKTASMLSIGINHDCCSLLKLNNDSGQPTIEMLDILSLPNGCIKEGRLLSPHQLQTTLQTLLSRHNIKTHKVNFALSRNLILHKQLNIPKSLTQQQIQDKATHESQKLFSDSIDDLYIDFAKKELNEDHDELDIIATHKQDIEPFMNVFKKLHLKTAIVDIDYYALERIFPLLRSQLPNHNDGDHTALFYMTSEYFLMIIFANDQILYVHHHNFHNESLEKTIASIINKSETQSEIISDASPAVKNVEHLLQFFFAEFTNIKINNLIIAGPLALVPDIANQIESQIAIKTIIADPLKAITHQDNANVANAQRLSSAYTLAAAMALRG